MVEKARQTKAVSRDQDFLVTAGIHASTRDPYVLWHDGHYYVYTTGRYVYQSCEDSLTGEFVYPSEPCVAEPRDYAGDAWAPEVYYYNKRFYMFTTYASNVTGKRGCAVFVSDSPTGPFTLHSDGHITPSDRDYIDGTLYIDSDGQPWLVYVKEWISMEDGIGRMFCAKLSEDLKILLSEPVELFRANEPAWAAGVITDGPFLYRTQKGSLLMIWSNHDSAGYCVGIAKSESGSVTGPWIQLEEPLYSRKYTGVYDGGHGMIFTDTKGKMWMAMHSPNTATEEREERTVFLPVKEENDTLVWDRRMVFYNERERILKLSNGSISYVIYINAAGCLETVWFGRALREDDYDGIRRCAPQTGAYFDTTKGEETAYEDYFDVGSTPVELSSHGRGDKRYAPIVIRKADGSYETDFRYVSHQVYAGSPSLPGYPHAHGKNCETVEFLLKDTASELYVRLFLTIYGDKDIIVKNYEIINKGQDTVHVLRAQSMQLDLRRMDYELVHFCGRLTDERNYAANHLHDGTQEVSSNWGISSHTENPFVYLKGASATMEYGEAIGFNLIYSGNFKFRVDCGVLGSAHLTYGLNDEDFDWKLAGGSSFVTPQAVISYSDSGIDTMSQNFHRFIKENIITYRHDGKYKPVLFNSWEGCYFDYDTEAILSYIEDAAAIGTELFVLDDGWFGHRNSDGTSLGDWGVNRQKIDLHRVMTYCRKKGIKFGIWFEPEMISPDSDLYRAHPDYALIGADSETLSLWRHQLCLDFSNPEAVEYIYSQMKAFLSEYPVDYIKWDYNRTVAEHFSRACGHEGRQGEVYHRLTLGYYSLLERLTREYPDLMIEGCAGGGGRFDLGTLYYCPQIWTSDESNPVRRMTINYNTSLGYPLSCMGTHVNDSRITDYRSKAVFALFGTYGYEMNPNRLSETDKAQLNEIAAIYRQYHIQVIAEGTLYHILSPNEGNAMALQCVSKDLRNSLVLYANRMRQLEQFRFLRLKGLQKDQLYTNTVDNCVHSGEYLMTVGLALPCKCEEFEYHLIGISAVSEREAHWGGASYADAGQCKG